MVGMDAQAKNNVVQEDVEEDLLGISGRLRCVNSQVTRRLTKEGTKGDCTSMDEDICRQLDIPIAIAMSRATAIPKPRAKKTQKRIVLGIVE